MRPVSAIKTLSLALVLIAAANYHSSGSAVTLSFTDRNAWRNALGSNPRITTEQFNYTLDSADSIKLPSGITSTGINPLDDARNLVDGQRYNGTVNRDGVNGYDVISWQLPTSTRAFAADWFTTNSLDGTTLSFGQSSLIFGDLLGSPGDGFLGFISDRPFSTIRFSTDGGTGNEFFAVDNFSFAAAIPEPSSLALLTGFLLMVVYRLLPAGAAQARQVA